MADPVTTCLSLFSGLGGLEIGLSLALPGLRVLGYVEREAFAAAKLLERMEQTLLEPAPVWCDSIERCGFTAFRDRVDVLCGGYPCPDFSCAGRGAGIAGDRGQLVYEVLRAIGECQPGVVLLENVRGHVRRGLDVVLNQLREMGYTARAGLFSAQEVGAPHKRERIFILGVSNAECQRPQGQSQGWPTPRATGRGGGTQVRTELVYTGRELRQRQGRPEGVDRSCCTIESKAQERERRGDAADDPVGELADRNGDRCAGEKLLLLKGRQITSGPDAPWASRLIPLFPPGPDDPEWDELLRWRADLAPALPRFARDLEVRPAQSPETQSAIRGMAHGLADRVDRLRACGNGVVPIQAAYAFLSLWACHVRECGEPAATTSTPGAA